MRDFYIIHEREFVESRTFRLRIPTFAITLKRDEVMQSENPESIVAAVFEDAVQRAARRYQYSPDDKVFEVSFFYSLRSAWKWRSKEWQGRAMCLSYR